MKPNIHPDYHEITVKMTNGSTFKTRSTYGEAGSVLALDVDITTHPAWTGGNAVVSNTGAVSDFNRRFAGLSFGTKKAATEEKKEEAASS